VEVCHKQAIMFGKGKKRGHPFKTADPQQREYSP
jgi:hypothetical protein